MIPKIIHQIWVGNDPIPDRCKFFMSKVKEMHPDWEYKLWTNKEVFEEQYKNDKFLQDWKDDIGIHFKPAHVADRTRLLLLRDFGGVYIDADAEPIKSFNYVLDELHDKTSFFGGVRYVGQDGNNSALIDCTVMGASKNSRMINSCLSIYESINWAWGGRALSEQMFKSIGPDTCLFNYEYFYDNKKGANTIVLHDSPENRLWSWK